MYILHGQVFVMDKMANTYIHAVSRDIEEIWIHCLLEIGVHVRQGSSNCKTVGITRHENLISLTHNETFEKEIKMRKICLLL